MSSVNIVRNDRGLDFKRIEQFVKMLGNKVNNKRRVLSKVASDNRKILQEKAFEKFNLNEELKAIQNIEYQIKSLKEQIEVHEKKIEKFTKTEDCRYGRSTEIREGSLVDKFIEENNIDNTSKEELLDNLYSNVQEELWLAKDINEAVEIYERYAREIEKI